ncbi:hypothetical protein AGMMS49982_01900 [Bacteroidia bacterium]|nr:hypothetical protein AGMMS49982_01900 [Bacteroidia bacterium]
MTGYFAIALSIALTPFTMGFGQTDAVEEDSLFNPLDIEMVFVEGSKKFAIADFYIGKYEVTQEQWEAVMGDNPADYRVYDHPVEHVSWNDVKQFLTKLNTLTGKEYRLPTEKEWAYAAGGGKKDEPYKYAGGDKISALGWYAGNSGQTTHPVGTKQPNSLGIYDMTGNVWEWCEDCYDAKCMYRVFRGGSWLNPPEFCEIPYRNYFMPMYRYDYLGVRVVYSAAPKATPKAPSRKK